MTNECEWRKEVDGIGVCGLHILPCRKVMEKGLCEYEHKVSEDDLISRQAVLSLPKDIIRNLSGEIIAEFVNLEDVKALPSAQPEIIRCKECKHYQGEDSWHNPNYCENCGAEMKGEA